MIFRHHVPAIFYIEFSDQGERSTLPTPGFFDVLGDSALARKELRFRPLLYLISSAAQDRSTSTGQTTGLDVSIVLLEDEVGSFPLGFSRIGRSCLFNRPRSDDHSRLHGRQGSLDHRRAKSYSCD